MYVNRGGALVGSGGIREEVQGGARRTRWRGSSGSGPWPPSRWASSAGSSSRCWRPISAADPLGAGVTRVALLTLGLVWLFVLSMLIVRREEGDLRWATVKRRLRLNAPRDPATGEPRRGSGCGWCRSSWRSRWCSSS